MTTTRAAIFGAGGVGREVHGYHIDLQAAGAPLAIALGAPEARAAARALAAAAEKSRHVQHSDAA